MMRTATWSSSPRPPSCGIIKISILAVLPSARAVNVSAADGECELKPLLAPLLLQTLRVSPQFINVSTRWMFIWSTGGDRYRLQRKEELENGRTGLSTIDCPAWTSGARRSIFWHIWYLDRDSKSLFRTCRFKPKSKFLQGC